MSEALDRTTDDAMLDELAGLLMSAARMAHERMAVAADERAFHDAGQTLHGMARSLRQTLALKGRSRREAQQAAREADVRASNRRIEQVIRRREVVRAAVERVFWTEHGSLEDAAEAGRRREPGPTGLVPAFCVFLRFLRFKRSRLRRELWMRPRTPLTLRNADFPLPDGRAAAKGRFGCVGDL